MPFSEAQKAIRHSLDHSEISMMDYDDDEFGELLHACETRFDQPEDGEADKGLHVFFGKSVSTYWCVHMRYESAEQKAAKAAWAEAVAAEADDSIGEG